MLTAIGIFYHKNAFTSKKITETRITVIINLLYQIRYGIFRLPKIRILTAP
jgi:hypothetical protein